MQYEGVNLTFYWATSFINDAKKKIVVLEFKNIPPNAFHFYNGTWIFYPILPLFSAMWVNLLVTKATCTRTATVASVTRGFEAQYN